MILYDAQVSSNAQKVRFLLAELELEYERRDVPFERPRPDWYREVSPLGLIPTLDDDGAVIGESNTILRYLADRESRRDLYPAGGADRARVDEALDRFSLHLRPALFAVEVPALGVVRGRGFGVEPPDRDGAARAAAAGAEMFEAFDALVPESGFLLGAFTLADVAAAPALHRTRVTGMDLSPYPGLARWRDAATARPAWATVGPLP